MSSIFFHLALVLAGINCADAVLDGFCSTNLEPETPGAALAFSKVLNARESAKQTGAKSLRCCARHYQIIEWYKDGKQLSIANKTDLDGVSFVYSLEQNQSLSATKVHASDSGNYTCIARNGSHSINHTIKLDVFVHDAYTGPPVKMIIPKDQWALPGKSAHFCCEAFVGYTNASEQLGTVTWTTTNTNINKSEYEKENGQVLGSLLIFDNVTEDDYGIYSCIISNGRAKFELNATLHNGVDPNIKIRTTYKVTVVILLVFVILWTILGATYSVWQLDINLFWKDHFGKLEENDNKLYDVFVCYDPEDSEFVLGLLVPVLENCFNYTTYCWERDILAGDWIPNTYPQIICQSRRFLMVISPALAKNSWCTYALYVAVENMLSLHSRIICITLKDVKCKDLSISDSDPKYLTLKQVLRVIKNVQWDPGTPHKTRKLARGSRKFWKTLRLYLPPRRALLNQNHTAINSEMSSLDSLL